MPELAAALSEIERHRAYQIGYKHKNVRVAIITMFIMLKRLSLNDLF
jgi:hypothetical protein